MMKLPLQLKELSSKQVQLCLRIRNFVTQDLGVDLKEKKLLLAVSGGADSMALLVIFNVLKKSMGFSINVCHLNHGIRPEATEEYNFVKSVCEKNFIPFFGGITKVLVYAKVRKMGIEEAARIIRYRYLEGIRKKTNSDFIITAHHLNDLAEDLLMRLIRGVGWPALGGMKAIDRERKILRRLLIISKKNLLALLESLKVKWYEDSSNYDLAYKRNRIRHNLLPIFLKENSNFLETVKHLWMLSQIDTNYFESVLADLRTLEVQIKDCIFVPRKEFLSREQSLRLRWYKDILSRLGNKLSLFSNLINLDNCVVHYRGPRTIQFPGDKKVEITGDKVKFYK